MKKAILDRLVKYRREGRCLACGEKITGGRTIRGLDERCARATYRAIIRGDFTDEERVNQGKWLPSNPTGRPVSNPVTVEARRKVVS